MPTIARQARITTKAVNLQDATGLVWTALEKQAVAAGGTYSEYGGKPGRLVRTTLKSIIESLFPEVLLLDETTRKAFESPIYTSLRATRSALIKERGGPGMPSVWWVADSYTPPNVITLPHGCRPSADKAPTATERNLTPRETGEDRTPGEVNIMPTPVGTIKPETEQRRQAVLALLAEYYEPLTEDEIRFALGLEFTANAGSSAAGPSKNGSLSHTLSSLVESKKIGTRIETTDERRIRANVKPPATPQGRGSRLYSSKRRVPARTLTAVVPGYVFSPGLMSYEGSKAFAAKKRDERNQRVLNALIMLARPVSPQTVGDLIGLSAPTVTDACKDLLEAELIHTDFHDRVRVYAAADVPLTRATPPSSPKEKPVTIAGNVTPTENGIILAAQTQLAGRDFTMAELASASGRSDSVCSDTIRNHPEYFTKVGTRNRYNVYRLKTAQETASVPPAPVPAPAAVSTPQNDLAARIARLEAQVSGAGVDQSDRVAELEAELNAAQDTIVELEMKLAKKTAQCEALLRA